MSGSCEHCRDLLWDLVWELLEPDQLTGVRKHLADCAACQKELRQAEWQQQRIARAARRDVEVPPFIRPEEPAAPRPAVVPFRRRLLTAGLAAAAAVLLTVGLPFWLYESRARTHVAAADAATDRLTAIQEERRQSHQEIDRAQQAIVDAGARTHLRMQLVSPAIYRPRQGSTHHLVLADLQGQPADAEVTARILAADNQELYRVVRQTKQGTLVVSLPPNLPLEGRSPRLEWTAVRNDARTSLTEPLPVGQADFITHLAVAKPLYQPGDVLFFRSVTLDRITRTPVVRPEEVVFTLTDPDDRVLHVAHGRLGAGGIAGGAIELPRKDLKEGQYTLTVTDPKGLFTPQARPIQVRGDRPVKLRKTLVFDQAFYRPGDKVTATVRAHRISNGQPLAKQKVFGHLKSDGKPSGLTIKGETDGEGVATLAVQLPKQVGGSVRLSVVINEPGNAEVLEREIPLEAPGVAVEFFPEGGDLITGVASRVYFRGRTKGGHPVELQGAIVDSQGREITRIQTAAADQLHGLGVFTFTPRAGEAYTFRAADGTDQVALPAARDQGVALSVPGAVVSGTEEIPITVQATGSPRTVLVAAFCRGRLVAYEALPALAGRRDLRLALPADLGGVIRLTAFEDMGEVRPVAERLIYRTPAQRLNVTVTTPNQPVRPGVPLTLTIRTTKEDGTPVPTWLLATVVDQDATGLTGTPGHATLPTHFHLLAELRRPEDLENANFLLSNHPQAANTLDLFLGTQGWRRFRETVAVTPRESAALALVKLDNVTEAWQTCEARLAAPLAELRQQAGERDRALFGRQEQEYATAVQARTDYRTFRETSLSWIRVGIVVGLVVGLMMVSTRIIKMVFKSEEVYTPLFIPRLSAWIGVVVGCVILAIFLLPHMEPAEGTAVAWGTLPRNPRMLETPAAFAAIPHTPTRQVAALPVGSDLATDSARVNLVQLEEQVERRSLAHGTAGKPIRSSTPGATIARPVSVPRTPPDSVKVPPPLPPPVPSEAREYAYLPPAAATPPTELPDTVLWHPTLQTKDGQVEVTLTLPRPGATYRVHIQGHDATGRFGAIHSTLITR